MLSALLERIFQGVDDATSAPTLKANLELLKSALELMERENNDLKGKIAILKQKADMVDILEKQLAELNQYEDLGIVKIKLDENGKRLPSLYCPQCGGMITNPETMAEESKLIFNISPHLRCLKKCGYSIDYRLLLSTLAEWDKSHSGAN